MRRRIISLSSGKAILLLACLITIFTIFGDKGFIEYQLLVAQEEKLDAEIEKLDRDKMIWNDRIYSLHNNYDYYENLAREKLGYLKKNERMIQIEYRE